MKRPRDNQKSKVYAWERQYIPDFWKHLSSEETQDIVSRVCSDLGMREPRIVKSRVKYWGGAQNVKFPGGCASVPIILHEMAHCITLRAFRYEIQYHGAIFMRVYLWLLEKHYHPYNTGLQGIEVASGEVIDVVLNKVKRWGKL
jgi:hypothetical protein